MSSTTSSAPVVKVTSFSSLMAQFAANSAFHRLALILVGSFIMAISAQIAVPMVPVPITMQSFAVIMIGALCGMRLSAEIMIAYLIEGAFGLPVFANGAAGIMHLLGPTFGYLAGYVPSAALIGYLADKGFANEGFGRAISLSIGHLLLFIPGVLWLSQFTGLEIAFYKGFTVFMLGTLIKTALAWFSLAGMKVLIGRKR